MDPLYLSFEDLQYELRVRGVNNVEAFTRLMLRTKLAEFQANETHEDLPLHESVTLDPMSEIEACTSRVDDLREACVRATIGRDLSGPSLYETRARQLLGRLARLQIEDPHLAEARKNLFSQIKELDPSLGSSEPLPVGKVDPATPSRTEMSYEWHRPKSIPVGQWRLVFDGDLSRQGVNAFIERVEELRQSRHVSRAELFESAIELFEGEALVWYRSIKSRVRSWDDIVRLLREEYVPADYELELWEEIRSRRQGAKERIGGYFAAMINLFSRLSSPPSEKERVDILRRNLDPYFIHSLGLVDCASVDELRQSCRRLENNRQLADKSHTHRFSRQKLLEPELAYRETPRSKMGQWKPREPSEGSVGAQRDRRVRFSNEGRRSPSPIASTSDANSGPNLKCWNCSQPGHRYGRCPKPRQRFCYRCGSRSHLATTCSKNESSGVRDETAQ